MSPTFNSRAVRAKLPFVLLVAGALLVGFALGAAIFPLDDDSEAAAGPTSSMTTAMPGMTHSGSTSTMPAHPVAGKFKPDDTKLAECRGDQGCYEQALGNIAYYQGPPAAFKVFDQRMQTDAAFSSGCHRTAHTIGSAALARYHGNVAEAFVRGSSSCASGYYHGILEHSFLQADAQTVADFGEVARGLCADPQVHDSPFLLFQCIHGLGHGLMIRSGYDLLFSLDVCDRLETDWDRRSCHGGVFMENISSSYGIRSQWLRNDDLIYPCRTIKESQKEGCYLIVTSRILEANGYDWKDAARVCRTSDPDWVDTCFQSFGRDAAGVTIFDANKAADLCLIAGDQAPECFYGAARAIANNHADPASAGPLCKVAPKASKPRCYEGIGTYVQNFNLTRETRRKACAQITDEYYKACLQGAGERAPGVSA
jgi:hypothetical protein